MLTPINSPCTNQCNLDEHLGICKGCFRTIEEVCNWPYFTFNEREDIRAQFEGRKIILEGGSN